MVRALAAAAAATLLLVGGAGLSVPAVAAERTEITESFNKAVQLLEAASGSKDAGEKLEKFKEARVALEKVLGLKPDADTARELRNLVKGEIITRVFLEAPRETIDKFKEVLALAEQGRKDYIRDKARIAELIKDLTAGEFDRMWIAIYQLKGAGQHAVPQLFEKLKTGNRDDCSAVTMALIAAGPSVVLPLAETLKIDDAEIEQEIIFILGQIGDARALPALAATAASATNEAVNTEAAKAVRAIAGDAGAKSAPIYYLEQAQAYYQKRFEVLQRPAEDYIIWTWDNEARNVAGRQVPEYAFYLEMAEKFCYDAIAINEFFEDIYPLLICDYFQQYHTYSDLLASAARAGENTLSEAEVKDLEARKARMVEILRTATALGKEHVYDALQMALADGNVAVAVSCSATLRKLGSTADLPIVPVAGKRGQIKPQVPAEADPLVAALDSANKSVRYDAAATLAGLADRQFPGVEKVAPILCQALGERGARVALVADSDVQVVNHLQASLKDQRLNYIVDIARDQKEALNVGFSVPMKDVLLVDAAFKKSIETFLTDYRTRNVPVIILTTDANAAEARAAFEGKGKVAAFLAKPIQHAALEIALSDAFRTVREDTGNTVALEMNYLAARALANVDVSTTVLPMNDTVPALVRALDLPDEVRLEALKALSNIASPAAQHELTQVAVNTANSLEARLGALEALASIAIKQGGTSTDVKLAAEKLINDKEPDVRTAAARLIGAGTSSVLPVRQLIQNAKWVSVN